MSIRAAIYCRVSTEDQSTNGTSLDSQQEACLKKAQQLGYEVPDDLVFRESFSGLELERPLFNILRNKAKDSEFGAIVVYSPDRLSRSGETILFLLDEFKNKGIQLRCVNNEFDDSPTGKLIGFILGWSSEYEAIQIKERTMRGKRTVASRGQLPQGTGAGLYGYKWDRSKKKRFPIEFETRIVERIFQRIAEGKSRFAVAKELNENNIPTKSGGKWHPLTIQRMVTNPAYIGKTYFGKTHRNGKVLEQVPESEWIEMPNATPPIISEELYNRAQKALEMAKLLKPGRPQNEYLLTGYIRCSYCGNPLIGSCLNHKYRYYHCRGAYPTSTRGVICKARYIRAGDTEEIVWGKVKHIIEHPNMILAELEKRSGSESSHNKHIGKQIASLKRKISSYDNQQKRLVKLFGLQQIEEDIILEEINQLRLSKQEDEAKLAQLVKLKEQNIDVSMVEGRLNEFCKRVKKNIESLDFQTKRLALDALDIKVIASDTKLDIKASVPLELVTFEKKFNLITV